MWRCAAKKTVAIFSLEMSREQLMNRLLAAEGGIDSRRLLTGDLSLDDWGKVAELLTIFSKCPMYMDDTAGITVAEMKAKLRRVRNLGLVVIDYLQLMSTGSRSDNRVQEVSEITRSLKIMAKELNVPVITLSQLSRGPESRSDHRPMLSDLRESGSIEQDADIVLFSVPGSLLPEGDGGSVRGGMHRGQEPPRRDRLHQPAVGWPLYPVLQRGSQPRMSTTLEQKAHSALAAILPVPSGRQDRRRGLRRRGFCRSFTLSCAGHAGAVRLGS